MQKKNCVSSIIFAAVFAFFWFQCAKLRPVPAFWPRMICVTGMALSLLEAVIEGVKWLRSRTEQQPLIPLSSAQIRRSASLLTVLALWIASVTRVGFLCSTIAALIVISLLFEPQRSVRNYVRDVIVCAVFGGIVYGTFLFLGVRFPMTMLP